MISHLNQYIIDKMTCSHKIVCIFSLCMVRYIFFGIKVISRLIGMIYENIAKMANKIFHIPNHLNVPKSMPRASFLALFAITSENCPIVLRPIYYVVHFIKTCIHDNKEGLNLSPYTIPDL